MSDCTCTHPAKRHCPGGVKHSFYKQELRSDPDHHVCTTRHCLEVLCSCVDYTPAHEPTDH